MCYRLQNIASTNKALNADISLYTSIVDRTDNHDQSGQSGSKPIIYSNPR